MKLFGFDIDLRIWSKLNHQLLQKYDVDHRSVLEEAPLGSDGDVSDSDSDPDNGAADQVLLGPGTQRDYGVGGAGRQRGAGWAHGGAGRGGSGHGGKGRARGRGVGQPRGIHKGYFWFALRIHLG